MAGLAFCFCFIATYRLRIGLNLNVYRYLPVLKISLFQNYIIALAKTPRVWVYTHISAHKLLEQHWSIPMLSFSGTHACFFGKKDSVSSAVHI